MATEAQRGARLDPSVFRLPVERIREGYYSDAYFNYTKQLLEERGHCPTVTMQVFQKEQSVLGGIDEAIAILKLCTGRRDGDRWEGGWDELVAHALIAAYGGDTEAAATAFADRYAEQMNVTVLVDFHNDSVHEAVAVADALGDRLWGVRLDTSDKLVDRALWDDMGYFKPTGVNAELVRRVRSALDDAGHTHVKIVCSGGFTAERIREFEAKGVPADSYGVGSSLLRGANDYTADVVLLEGRPCAKAGREFRPNPRLERVS